MAKKRCSRARGGCFHAREVVESRLTIIAPAAVNEREARVMMTADEGELVMSIDAGSAANRIRFRLSGIELHTALHALGFVRLNDRCGHG